MAKGRLKPDPKRRAELLAAVLANPSDDAPRLVLADWLSEHGDPRGEFIVVQCARAKIPHGKDKQRALDLDLRAADLHKRYAGTWTPFFRGMNKRPQYHFVRGFISTVRVLHPERLDVVMNELLSAEPVEALMLEQLQDDLEAAQRTFALERFSAITSLTAIAYTVEEQLAQILVDSPRLSGLTTLNYGHFGGTRAVGLLARATNLGSVGSLSLHYGGITDAGAQLLAAATGLPRVYELNLANNNLTDAGARFLAQATGLPKLRELSVRANEELSEDGRKLLAARYHLT